MGKSKDTRRLQANQAQAVCNALRTSPRKLNLVAESIRGLAVEKAVAELTFSKKRIAKSRQGSKSFETLLQHYHRCNRASGVS